MSKQPNSGADRVSEQNAAYAKKPTRRKFVIHTLEEMQNMEPPFPDETEWALELEADAKRREEEEALAKKARK